MEDGTTGDENSPKTQDLGDVTADGGSSSEVESIALGSLPPVTRTAARYRRITEYARGGMGRVLLVHDEYLDRDIALKELILASAPESETLDAETTRRLSEAMAARFLREARITGQLEHPSIVPVHELARREDDTLFYTMKFVRGHTLGRAIATAKTLPKRMELLSHYLDLCQAIAYAHSHGVLHRDIKPSNVMLGEFGETIVVDWGLAKTKDSKELPIADLPSSPTTEQGYHTEGGKVLGTPSYMSPEQASGDVEQVTEASDVFSLGVVLYELLTGRRPFECESSAEILEKIRTEAPPPVKSIERNAPVELAAVCRQAMKKAPEDRYPSAKELADEVLRYLSGAMVQAHRYTPVERLSRFARRHGTLIRTAAAAFLILLVMGIISYVQVVEAHDRERAQRLAAEEANRQLVWENYSALLGMAQKRLDEGAYVRGRQLLWRCPAKHRGWEWGSLLRRSSPALLTLRVGQVQGMPPGSLYKAIFSPDSRYILDDRPGYLTKSLFDIQQGETVRVIGPYPGWRECTQFLGDGSQVSVATGRHVVEILDLQTGESLARFDSGAGALRSFILSPSRELAAGYNLNDERGTREVIIWDPSTGSEKGRFQMASYRPPESTGNTTTEPEWAERHRRPRGQVLGFLDANRRLLFVDEHLGVLDVDTGEQTALMPVRNWLAAYDSKSKNVVIQSEFGNVEVWNISSEEKVAELEGATRDWPSAVAISPGGRIVALGSGDTLALWRGDTGELLGRRQGHSMALNFLAFSPNGACVAGVDASEVKLWSVLEDCYSERIPIVGADGNPVSLELPQIKPGGGRVFAFGNLVRYLATTDTHGRLFLWDVPSFKLAATWEAHKACVRGLAFSSDDQLLASASVEGTVKIWRTATQEPVLTVEDAEEQFFAVAFSPDSARLAVGTGDHIPRAGREYEIRVLDTSNGQCILTTDRAPHPVYALAYSPDGRWLAAGRAVSGDEGVLHVMDAGSGGIVSEHEAEIGIPWEITFTPDSRGAIVLGSRTQPFLWDLDERREVWRLLKTQALQVAMHPAGDRFALVAIPNEVSVHAVSDGRELIVLEQEGQWPAAFSADGRVLHFSGDVASAYSTAWMASVQSESVALRDESAVFQEGLLSLQEHLALDP